MDFAHRLWLLLNPQQQQGKGFPFQDIERWNVDIEALLFASPEEQKQILFGESKTPDNEEEEEEGSCSKLDDVANNLRKGIIIALFASLGLSSTTAASSDDETTTTIADEDCLKLIMEHIVDGNGNGDDNTVRIRTTPTDSTSEWAQLEILVRTSSNYLRWYLQVYLQKFPLVYPMCSSPFQSTQMLTIILFLIEVNGKIDDNDTTTTEAESSDPNNQQTLSASQRFARYASLLLFYATFSPRSPNDEDMQRTHERLVTELGFIPRVLKLLTYQPRTSAALALSLIRNVHNLLASFPGAIKAVQETGLPYDEAVPAKAPWSPQKDDNTAGLITYPSIFRDILIWSLNTPTLPPFPGPKEDRRADLVVEILAIIFAMGGTEVARALRHPCPNPSLSQLVITALLHLDSDDPRTYQVKLSTITILTDASPSFGTFLVENKDAVKALLEIAEKQVDRVLNSTQADATAVSALVPSLAVLYKLSAGNPEFRDATKDIVFPPSQEDHFWQLAQEQLATNNNNNHHDIYHQSATTSDNPQSAVPTAKNMHPLDAPRGSLRWKLIRLMTWTESHIKRYVSELLWALCDEDPKEFVLRTGLGNAMALLSAKGMVQLPAGANNVVHHHHQG